MIDSACDKKELLQKSDCMAGRISPRIYRRIYSVCGLFVGLTAASSVFAGTWGDFEQRCLDRFEHVFPADLTGLTRVDADDSTETWTNTDTILRRATPGGVSEPFCAIVGEIDEPALTAWETEALASGRYTDVSPDQAYAPHVLQSTEWREPRIEVVVVRDGEPMLMVIETDLES